MLETLSHCILCDSPNVAEACQANRFSRCEDCGHFFDNPRPNWDSVLAFYSQHDKYDDWLREEEGRNQLWQRRLRLVRRYVSSGALLDVGAGIGQFLHFAQDAFDVSGTEISPTAVGIAREKYGIRLRQGFFESMQWEQRFDALTMFHVLEHVPRPSETLQACYNALKPGAALIIAVPNDIECVWTRRNRVLRRWGFHNYEKLGELGLPPLSFDASEIHLSHFTPGSLSQALQRTGFDVIDKSLDPYFSVTGMRKFRRYRRFFTYQAIAELTGNNLYETQWVVARKR